MTDPHEEQDEAFRRIVAGFDQGATEPVPRWPVSEDLTEPDNTEPGETEPGTSPTGHSTAAPRPDDGLPGWLEPEALPAEPETESHFVPPAAPRLPRPQLRTVASTCMLLLGLVALFAPYRLGLDSSGSIVLGMLLTAGGAVMLVNGVRDDPDVDEDPDAGAVV